MTEQFRLGSGEILCTAHRVKYSHVEKHEGYIVVEQNRTRRRVPDGYHFYDDGRSICLSVFYSCFFQHKQAARKFVLNKETKEWREWHDVIIERHQPERVNPKDSNEINDLKR